MFPHPFPLARCEVLTRAADPVPPMFSDLYVRGVYLEEADRFGALLAQGLRTGPASKEAWSRVVGAPGWYPMGALDIDDPDRPLVAAACLFVSDGTAVLAGAATLPAYRGRGAYRAMLNLRIRLALRLGCTHVSSAVWGDGGGVSPGGTVDPTWA